jgi:hypothetical protein
MRKIIIAVTGGTVLVVGIAMLVLPGPGLVVIPAALAILATEFMWARRALKKLKSLVTSTRDAMRKSTGCPPGETGKTASREQEMHPGGGDGYLVRREPRSRKGEPPGQVQPASPL